MRSYHRDANLKHGRYELRCLSGSRRLENHRDTEYRSGKVGVSIILPPSRPQVAPEGFLLLVKDRSCRRGTYQVNYQGL